MEEKKIDPEEVEFIKTLSVLCVKPGDVLVLQSEKNLNQAQFDRLRSGMKKGFPNNEFVLLDGVYTLGVVREDKS